MRMSGRGKTVREEAEGGRTVGVHSAVCSVQSEVGIERSPVSGRAVKPEGPGFATAPDRNNSCMRPGHAVPFPRPQTDP